MTHKMETDEYQTKMIGVEKERDEMKRAYEIVKAEFENLKIEIDKERILGKQKYREELEILMRENESL